MGLTVTVPVFAAYCYIETNPQVIQQNHKTHFDTADKSIEQAIKQLEQNTERNIAKQTDAVVAGLRVLATQKAYSQQQIAQAYEENAKTEASIVYEAKKAQKAQDAVEDTIDGAGYDPCGVLDKRQKVVSLAEATAKTVPEMVRNEVFARPGSYGNRKAAFAQMMAQHDAIYCTEDQAAAGMCTGVGKRAGRSLDASVMFENTTRNSDSYHDKSAFINNIIGLPDDIISREQAATSTGQAYTDLKRRTDAIKSTALVSLKNIQASWSSTGDVAGHTHGKEDAVTKNETTNAKDVKTTAESATTDATTNSLAEQMKKDVGRYLGGEEYKNWSASLVGLNERGVLQEVIKVKALRLYMQAEQYKQLTRMEAMLAAIVAADMETNGSEAKISEQRAKVLSGQAASSFGR